MLENDFLNLSREKLTLTLQKSKFCLFSSVLVNIKTDLTAPPPKNKSTKQNRVLLLFLIQAKEGDSSHWKT